MFNVADYRSYFVASLNDNGDTVFGPDFDNSADALAFADVVGDGCFVVLRDALDFSGDYVRVPR